VALSTYGLGIDQVRLEASGCKAPGHRPADEMLIAERLVREGLCPLS
jgi:hypothetical protein